MPGSLFPKIREVIPQLLGEVKIMEMEMLFWLNHMVGLCLSKFLCEHRGHEAYPFFISPVLCRSDRILQ
jgi:hypothetical protein